MVGERDQQALYFQAIKRSRDNIYQKKILSTQKIYLQTRCSPSSPHESNPIALALTMLLKPVKNIAHN